MSAYELNLILYTSAFQNVTDDEFTSITRRERQRRGPEPAGCSLCVYANRRLVDVVKAVNTGKHRARGREGGGGVGGGSLTD